jgi:hypothetical protein
MYSSSHLSAMRSPISGWGGYRSSSSLTYPASLRQGLTPEQGVTIETAATWLLPAVAIPTLRYINDDKKERDRLFVRDASTYVIGAGLFLGVRAFSQHVLTVLTKQGRVSLSPHYAKLMSFFLALAANLAYSGVGAVKVSKWVEARHRECFSSGEASQ